MIDLKQYVDELFRHQRLTPEVKDLKEEILSNMTAKIDDLIAQGMDADIAAKKAKSTFVFWLLLQLQPVCFEYENRYRFTVYLLTNISK